MECILQKSKKLTKYCASFLAVGDVRGNVSFILDEMSQYALKLWIPTNFTEGP